MAKRNRTFLVLGLTVTMGLGLFANAAAAAELLVLETPGCAWCVRWNEEIAAIYPKTTEGRIAPLRRINLSKPWPDDLPNITADRFTPTFILVADGREVARLRGYAGEHFFWPMLGEMLSKLPQKPMQ